MTRPDSATWRKVFHVIVGGLLPVWVALSLVQGQEEWPSDEPAAPVEPGKKLIAELGCPVCHEIDGHDTTVREEAPDLSFEGELIRPDWLFEFLKAPSQIRPAVKARMPNFRLSDEETLSITDYLATLKDREARTDLDRSDADGHSTAALVETGRALTTPESLGCVKCHVVGDRKPSGDPSTWAPDLARVRERLDPRGVLSWIRNPPRYRPNTKMPIYFSADDSASPSVLSDEQERTIQALRAFVFSLGRNVRFDEYEKARASGEPPRPLDGRSLLVKLNCVGCHNVAALPDGRKVGPSLNTEGSRVRREWLLTFLKQPRTIKPEYAILGSFARMPDFRLTDDEAVILTDYIAKHLVDEEDRNNLFDEAPPTDLAREGAHLFEEKQCIACHRIGAKAGGIGPDLTEAGNRLRPGWVYRFILNPSHFLETRMPNLQVSEEQARALTAYLMSRKEP